MKKNLTYALSTLLAVIAVFSFTSCSKQADTPRSIQDPIWSSRQIDSIAAVYGYKRSDSTSSAKSITATEFISKMKARNKKAGRTDGTATLLNVEMEETTYVDFQNYDYFGENGLHTRHFNFANFKSAAYPSLYTITIMSDGLNCTLLGSSFDYVGLGNEVPEVTWSYNQTGGYAMGSPRLCDVFIHGITTEHFQIAGQHYTKVYRTEFQSTRMDLMHNYFTARIKLVQVS